ncbi:MAG: DNA polymerase III subunit delta' [Rhodospirillales bacterium]|nr:DNA polymerase III subunit delta' [Rhodospirillales bacterium]
MNAKKAASVDEPAWPPPARLNPELTGQADAERVLLDAFHGGRMAHAWLLCGQKGIGKATLAYRFARHVLSQNPDGPSQGLFGEAMVPDSLFTDPLSPVFKRVAAGSHGDLLSVERSLNDRGKLRGEVVVEDVRDVGEFFSMTASEGGWRIVIVDSADEMNRHAANAVLKVLEEPPNRALLLLVSHNPGQLLPTIRSRCRMLHMKALDAAHMDALLVSYAPDLGADDRARLIELSDGSIGRAVDLIAAGGIELYRDILDLLSTLPELSVAKLHLLADRLAKAGAEAQFYTAMDLLRCILARFLRFAAEAGAAGSGGDQGFADERDLFMRLIPGAGLDRWLEVWEKMCGLLERTGAIHLDRKQVVLNIFLEFDGALRNR